MPDVPVGGPECTYETLPIDSAIAVKGHYCQVPIFTEWLPYLGQIVFLWGMFEGKWNAFLEAMFASTDIIPETGWRKRKGKKRIHLFTEQVNKTFPKESAISIYMHELVRDSVLIQDKRNLLLHGVVSLMMGPDPHMIVDGLLPDGHPDRHEYREIDIKKLFYEISHLVGRFTPLFHPESKGPPLSSQDKLLLQAFWRKARQNLSHSKNT